MIFHPFRNLNKIFIDNNNFDGSMVMKVELIPFKESHILLLQTSSYILTVLYSTK